MSHYVVDKPYDMTDKPYRVRENGYVTGPYASLDEALYAVAESMAAKSAGIKHTVEVDA